MKYVSAFIRTHGLRKSSVEMTWALIETLSEILDFGIKDFL